MDKKDPNDPLNQEVSPPTFYHSKKAEVYRDQLEENGIRPNEKPFSSGIRAIEKASSMFGDIEKARNMLIEDDSRTTLDKRIALKKYANKKSEELSSMVDAVDEPLKNYINNIDSEIEREMSKKARESNFARATWEHLQSMEDKQARRSFILQQIKSEQWDVVDDILGVDRGFIVGLDEDDLEFLREQYKQARYKEKIKRRDTAKELRENLESGWEASIPKFTKYSTEEVNKAMKQQRKTTEFLNG